MKNFREFIKIIFEERKIKNKLYSTHAFARDLNISQSFLSQILNGKKKVSIDKAEQISEKLKLKGKKKLLFLELVNLEHCQNEVAKKYHEERIKIILKKQVSFKKLSANTFEEISDWYYFAILELSTLKKFKNSPLWISKKLNISVLQAKLALQKLEENGLLISKNGKLVKAEEDYIFENVPSAAIKKHHHQTLDLAHKALDNQDLDTREFFTVSFPMNLEKINYVKTKIKDFSEDLMKEVQSSNANSVYKISIQFFRLDSK